MIWLVISLVALICVGCFSGVVLFGAPYLPTLSPQIASALKLIDLKEGETLLELGCGDGRVLIAAASQGLNVIGYELNPLLVIIARWRSRHYRQQVQVIWGNFWHQAWPPSDGAFVFLLDKYMAKLDKKCMHYQYKPLKLVSFAFQVPGRKPLKQQAGVYLYNYPK